MYPAVLISLSASLGLSSSEIERAIAVFLLKNVSKEFTNEKLRDLIEHLQKKNNWGFIFIGANIDAAKEAGNIGISEDNMFDFETSKDGVEKMYCMACEAVTEKGYNKGKKKCLKKIKRHFLKVISYTICNVCKNGYIIRTSFILYLLQ